MYARNAIAGESACADALGAEGEKCPLMLGLLVLELTQAAGELFPKDISIETTVEPALWPVIGNAAQLYQVLLNLGRNARDAMPAGGRLQIRACNLEIDADYCRTVPEARPGRHVVLEIADSGHGMSCDTLSRIFDPFFTTKTREVGRGLGLSTAREIVRGHGGFITVASEPVRGTVFNVFLPAAPAETGRAEHWPAGGIPAFC